MNYDLITKLAKLANNNPNEHEANLAARKVCKLLAEGEFKFVNSVQQSQPNWHNSSVKFDGFDFGEILRNMYERSYTRPPNNPNARSYGSPKTASEKMREDQDEQRKKHEYRYGSWNIPKNEPYQKWPGNDPFKKPSEQQKEERLLKCKTCKNSKLTKFVGLAELYECNTCQWTAYEAKSKK